MDKIFIGKIVSTHGIKGELKILSDFQYKSKAFTVGNKLIIDDMEYIINSYRVHKNFDMITLNGYTNINEVLFLLKKNVYLDKENLLLDDTEVLDQDLITYKVLTNTGKVGIIKEIFRASETNKIIRVMFDKEVLIPVSFIKKIDKSKKEIVVELIDGMK